MRYLYRKIFQRKPFFRFLKNVKGAVFIEFALLALPAIVIIGTLAQAAALIAYTYGFESLTSKFTLDMIWERNDAICTENYDEFLDKFCENFSFVTESVCKNNTSIALKKTSYDMSDGVLNTSALSVNTARSLEWPIRDSDVLNESYTITYKFQLPAALMLFSNLLPNLNSDGSNTDSSAGILIVQNPISFKKGCSDPCIGLIGAYHSLCVCGTDFRVPGYTDCYCNNYVGVYAFTGPWIAIFWENCLNIDRIAGRCSKLPIPHRAICDNSCLAEVAADPTNPYALKECACKDTTLDMENCICIKYPLAVDRNFRRDTTLKDESYCRCRKIPYPNPSRRYGDHPYRTCVCDLFFGEFEYEELPTIIFNYCLARIVDRIETDGRAWKILNDDNDFCREILQMHREMPGQNLDRLHLNLCTCFVTLAYKYRNIYPTANQTKCLNYLWSRGWCDKIRSIIRFHDRGYQLWVDVDPFRNCT